MAPKFLSADGGWDRIVWMAKTLKDQLAGFIPEEVYARIATEDDAVDVTDLKDHLKKEKHPVIAKFWKGGEPEAVTTPVSGEMWPGDEEYLPL
jgi:acetyl-CoA decarbonylase/synthase complex subunit beta